MKYWVYLNGEVPGSYTPAESSALADFFKKLISKNLH